MDTFLFLDFDGVLNSERWGLDQERRHQEAGEHQCRCFHPTNQIDPEAIARLNKIIAATKAKVVLSTSWRNLLDVPTLTKILEGAGFVGEIIGATPDLPNDQAYIDRRAAENGGTYGIERIERGHEIAEWLRLNTPATPAKGVDEPLGTRIVILDDCGDMAHLKHRLVCTDWRVGLTDDDVELAINMSSWPGHPAV